MFISYKNDTHLELAMMALAASPSPEEACAFLLEEHNLQANEQTLKAIVRMRPTEYEELRAKIVPIKEKRLAHNMLDDALYASEVTREAMSQLKGRLEEGKIPPEYLSRVARHAQDVETKAVDKKLALENRPSHITETRTPAELLRSLERLGVMKQIEVEVEG